MAVSRSKAALKNLKEQHKASVILLLVHSTLLFSVGTLLAYHKVMYPLWASALLIMYWVPKDLIRIRKVLSNSETPPLTRQELRLRSLIIVILILPYIFLPGHLFAYPVSDLGFRLTFGNRLQNWALQFLESPAHKSDMIARNGHYRGLEGEPPEMAAWLKILPARTIVQTGPSAKHLVFIHGGGFGHWGLLVGPPAFRATSSPHSEVREMWPGVYYHVEIQ